MYGRGTERVETLKRVPCHAVKFNMLMMIMIVMDGVDNLLLGLLVNYSLHTGTHRHVNSHIPQTYTYFINDPMV